MERAVHLLRLLHGRNASGEIHSSFGGCNISYAGVEHTVSNYYVLVPDWLGSSKFDFPAGSDTEGKSAKCLPGVSQWRIYIPRQNAVNLESLQLRVEREGRMGQLV